MMENNTIQIIRKIVGEMGADYVCQHPAAFAGAILDMCDADDVKLLTNALRAHYGARLMDYFRDGGDDAMTWTQQKTFFVGESGMSEANAEFVLDALWQVMGWHRPRPSEPEPEPVRQVDPKYRREYVGGGRTNSSDEAAYPKVDPKNRREYVGGGRTNSSDEAAYPKVDPQYRKEHIDTGQPKPAAAQKADLSDKPRKTGQQAKRKTSKAVPLLISAVWLFLALQLSSQSNEGSIVTRIQGGELRLVFYLAAPFIATLLVSVKGCPNLLQVLAALVLGFVALYNWVVLFYVLDHDCFHWQLLFSDSAAGVASTCLVIFTAVIVGIIAGRECGEVSE